MRGLTKYDKVKVPLSEIRPFLPEKSAISWNDELKGDKLMGYEIRGIGEGFRAWVQGTTGGHDQDLNETQKTQLLAKILQAKSTFFP